MATLKSNGGKPGVFDRAWGEASNNWKGYGASAFDDVFGDASFSKMTDKYKSVASTIKNSGSPWWSGGWRAGAAMMAAGGLSYGATYVPSGVGMALGGMAGAAAAYRMAPTVNRFMDRSGLGDAMGRRAGIGSKFYHPGGFGFGHVQKRGMTGLGRAALTGGGGIAGMAAGAVGMGMSRWLWD